MRVWEGGLCIGNGLGFVMVLLLSGGELCSPGSPLVRVIIGEKEIQCFGENMKGVWEGLREEGFQNDLNLKVTLVTAASDCGPVARAAEDFYDQGARLLTTLGIE
jgi:hypothetical protein